MRLRLFAALPALALLSACGGGGADQIAKLKAQLPAPYNMGDFDAGKQVFLQCAACHSDTKDGADMTGPNLYGVFGRKAGSKPGFSYSPALAAAGWTWDAAKIDQWVSGPQAVLPGTKMVFVGVKDPTQRRDLIAYLKVATSGGPH
jgi:cytochrome c